MQIEVKGRNLQVTDEMREYVERRFDKIGKQVSELAVLELEVADENVPGDPVAAEAVLHLKGTHAARQGGLQGRQARDQPRRRQHGAPGQAPPRQAPRPARVARRGGRVAHTRRAPTLEEDARNPLSRPGPGARGDR